MGKNHTQERKLKMLEAAAQEIRSKKRVFAVYFVLRFLVIATMILQIFNRDWNSVFMCVLTLILFLVPAFIDRKLHIELPNTLQIIILLFIFAAEILGEIHEYYLHFEHWDAMLHTINGFLMAAIGFSMIDILNESERFAFKMSPLFVALVSFCFSMTVGVLWEFFEYGMDVFFLTDMQKDTILDAVTSVVFEPSGRNVPITRAVDMVVVNGEPWNYGGYIDVGLHDTMHDLIVNFIGAVVFSVIGMFYIKGRNSGTFAKKFIPRKKTRSEIKHDEEVLRQERLEKELKRREKEGFSSSEK